MPQRIQAPDGTLVEFPDGMSDAAISQAMRREYGGPKPAKTSQTLGFAKGLLEPMSNLAVRSETALKSVGYPVDQINAFMHKPSEVKARASMDNYFAEREMEGVAPGRKGEIAGNIVATVPIAMATRNPWAAGAAQGFMLSDAKDAKGLAIDTATGAVLGKVGDMAVGAVSRGLKPIVDPAVAKLQAAGVRMTPGQMRGGRAMVREDKAMSRPILGDAISEGRRTSMTTFNTAMVDRALSPMGVKIPKDVTAGHDAVAFAQGAIDDAYNAIVPKLVVRPDPRFVAGLKGVYSKTVATLPDPLQRQFQSILETVRFSGDGSLAGRPLKTAQSELSRLAKTYAGSAVASERELGQAIYGLKSQLDDLMVRQNPTYAPVLKQTNAAFRNLTIVEDAASRADEGLATTAQWRQASRRADASRRKGATARGEGPMQDLVAAGRKVLPAKIPDSGTSGRNQSNSFVANVRGAMGEAAYRADNAFTQLAAKSPTAKRAGELVDQAKPYLRLMLDPFAKISD